MRIQNDGTEEVPAGKMEELFNAVSGGVIANFTDEERQKFRKAHVLNDLIGL